MISYTSCALAVR